MWAYKRLYNIIYIYKSQTTADEIQVQDHNWQLRRFFFLSSHWSSKKCEGSDHPFSLRRGGGGSKFWLPGGGRGGSEKLKKGWKNGARAGLLKRGGWHFSYLIFWRFIIFTFRNYFTPLSKLCYAFEKKIFFLSQ